MMMTGIILGVVMVVTFGMGVLLMRWKPEGVSGKLTFGLNFLFLVGLIFWAGQLIIPQVAFAAESGTVAASSAAGLGYLAAGLSVGLASIGAGIGVGIAGAAAIGSISEKPEILGRTLIFIGLAEGVAIYGLIISIMILGRIG